MNKEFKNLEKQLEQDKKKAKRLLQNYELLLSFVKDGEIIERHIDLHNIEYCFIRQVWDNLTNYQRIATIIKYSQKINSDFFIKLDNFKNCSLDLNQKIPLAFYNNINPFIVINYNSTDFENGFVVLMNILTYKDRIKEKIFLDLLKTKNLSIKDFKNIEQLRYLIYGREDMILEEYPEVLKSSYNKYELKSAILYDGVKQTMSNREAQKTLNVLKNICYFLPEFKDDIDGIENFNNELFKNYKKNVEKFFGNKSQRDEKFLHLIYKHFLSNELNYEKYINHFMAINPVGIDEDIFENIQLPKQKDDLQRKI